MSKLARKIALLEVKKKEVAALKLEIAGLLNLGGTRTTQTARRPAGRHAKLRPEEVARILQLRAEGKTGEEIADEINRSSSSVWTILKKAGKTKPQA